MADQALSSPNFRLSKRRWLKVLFIILAVLIVLVALGPAIISTGPVRRLALRQINRHINGQLSIDSWSIGWFSGISVQSLSLLDTQSRQVVHLQSISLNPSYTSLLGSRPRLGKIRLKGLEIQVWFDELGRTSLETISPPSGEPSPPSQIQPTLELQIENGTITVHKPDGSALSVENLNSTLQLPLAPQPLTFQVACNLSDKQGSGRIQAQGQIPLAGDGSLQTAQLQAQTYIQAHGFDLALLGPLLQRRGLGLTVTGLLDAQVQAQINSLQNLQVSCQASCPEIRLTGETLKTDELHLRNLAIQAQGTRRDNQVELTTLHLESDLLSLQSQGRLNLPAPQQTAEQPQAELTGQLSVDLANLLNQLPVTLHLRPGLKVTQGTVSGQFALSSTSRSGLALKGAAVLEKLQGSLGSRAVQLDDPVRFEFDLIRSPARVLQFNQLSMTGSFGHFAASGTPQALALHSDIRLDTLDAELHEFLDLGKISFGGQVLCDATLNRAEHRWDIQAALTGKDLVLRGFGPQGLNEPQLHLDTETSLLYDQQDTLSKVSFKSLRLSSSVANLSLVGTVDLAPLDFAGSVAIDADLAKLRTAVREFVDLGNFRCSGRAVCRAELSRTAEQLNFNTDLTATDLLLAGVTLRDIRQPHLQMHLQGVLGQDQRHKLSTISLSQAQLQTNLTKLQFSAQADLQPLAVSAQGQIDGDISELWNTASALADFSQDIQPAGHLQSALTLNISSSRLLSCAGDSAIGDLQLLRKDGRSVRQPNLSVKHRLSYDLTSKNLNADILEVQHQGLAVKLSKLSLTPSPQQHSNLDLQGTVQSDLAQLTPWLVFFDALRPETKLAGQLSAKGSYFSMDQRKNFTIDSDATSLQVFVLDQQVLAEPKLSVGLEGYTDAAARILELSRLRIAGSFLQADGQITSGLAQAAGPARVRMQIRGDLPRLNKLIQPWIKDWPELNGSAALQVDMTGQVPTGTQEDWAGTLAGTAILEVDPQEFGGLTLGPAKIDMQAADGILTIKPVAITTNQGLMNLAGRLGLGRTKPFLTIDQPLKLLENVQVNPAMSNTLLKFINPLFANTHEVSGQVNFTSNRLLIENLATWKKTARMSGLFSGKDLRIVSNRGLMADLATVLKLDLSAKLGEIKPVSIELADGRVSYNDMHIIFGSLVDISFSGQVGLDESLNMRIGIPILPAMLGNRPELIKYLGDQRIFLPITGTLSQPRLDVAAVPKILAEMISRLLLQNMAAEKIGEVLQDVLNPSPPPSPPPP